LKGKEEEEGKNKGGEDKPVVNPLEDKEPVLNPPEPVPVRLDSQPLESASSQGSAEGHEDKAEGHEDKAEGQEDKVDDTKVIIALCFYSLQHKSYAALVIPENLYLSRENVIPTLAFMSCSSFVLWSPMLPWINPRV